MEMTLFSISFNLKRICGFYIGNRLPGNTLATILDPITMM